MRRPTRRTFLAAPVPRAAATGDLAALYDRIAGRNGEVAHVLTCTGLNAAATLAHYDLYRAVMFGRSPLSRAEREMVAVTVARTLGCRY